MNANEYLSRVEANYSQRRDDPVDSYHARMFYEERFEFKWLATKLKIFSFAAYLPAIRCRTSCITTTPAWARR